jgi:eukaryotic-like serine/threonine-protein kinase
MSDDADTVTASEPVVPARGASLQPGELIAGRFRVLRTIATGGMGIVFEVLDEKLGERRAMKCARPGFAAQLPPEARHALRVTHPNVCRVYEIHTASRPDGNADFLTMELIEGGTLAARLATGPLPLKDAREIARQICAGLAAAHAQGVLHRDLKPGNVLIEEKAPGTMRAVITDFGIAQEPVAPAAANERPATALLTDTAGTPLYLAPERRRGARASIASDIYSLGVVLHELVTGHGPTRDAEGGSVLDAGVPALWRGVIARCLETRPEDRFQSAMEVADALSGRRQRRRRVAAAVVVAAAAGAVAWRVFLPTPLAARVVVLPIEANDASAATKELIRGASIDVDRRLRQLTRRPRQLVFIPLEKTLMLPNTGDRAQLVRTALGATHVVRAVVTERDALITVRGSIIDTTSTAPLSRWTDEFPSSNAAAIAPSIIAAVTAAFRAPKAAAAEAIAPAAYDSYTRALSLARDGGGRYDEAAAAAERAAALDPKSALPRALLVEISADAYNATRQAAWLARGREALANASVVSADSLAVRLAAGRLSEMSHDFPRAVREFTRATEIDPNSSDGWRGLGRVYDQMSERTSDAAAAFQKAIAVQPDFFGPLIDAGDFYRLHGDYAQAEAMWRRAAELAPDGLAAHVNLGGLYGDLGRYADAERELLRAAEIDSHVSQIFNNLGSLYQYMGRDADAVAQFERARAIGPDRVTLLLNLGDSYRRLGRLHDASVVYEAGRVMADDHLAANPRDAVTRAYLAYFAMRLGDSSTAEHQLAQALAFDPSSRTVVRRAAIVYEAMGHRDLALGVLQSAPRGVLEELSRHPDLRSLQADARFRSLLSAAR